MGSTVVGSIGGIVVGSIVVGGIVVGSTVVGYTAVLVESAVEGNVKVVKKTCQL